MRQGRYEPYTIRRSCERCSGVDYVARLVVPFHRPIDICRRCRQTVTGVPDTRNMENAPRQGTATMAAPEPIGAPAVRGLLLPGPAISEDL